MAKNVQMFQQPVRVGVKTADPTVDAGTLYYNSTSNVLKIKDNSSFKTIADRSFLSSTASGSGASQVGIEDFVDNFTSTNVEGALAELWDLASAGGTSTFADDMFRVQDNGDATKQLAMELAGATTGKTMTLVSSQSDNRSLTLPDTSDTLVAAAFAQTLTNKTIVAASNTITTAASGNLASVELNAALAELQSDIDSRALDSAVIKKNGSVAFTADQSMGGFKLTSLANGTASGDAVNYSQLSALSSMIENFEWQESAISIELDSDNIVSPSAGDRYLIAGTGLNDFASHDNAIAEWNGSAWVFTVPTTGTYIAIDDESDGLYNFGGASWAKKYFEATTASTGLVKVGFDIRLDSSSAGDGLGFSSGILSVNVDSSTIEINADTLRVKAAGISNNEVASGIDAVKIADGSVSNTEFQYLDGVTSAIQTQINAKVTGPASATDNAIARFDSTTGKLIQNSTSSLSDTGGLSIADSLKRGDSNLTDFIEEKYKHEITLTASTTDVASEFTFDSKVIKALVIDYTILSGTDRRVGKLMVVCDQAAGDAGLVTSITDEMGETADVGVQWDAALNGDNVELSYTTSAGTKTMRADIKKVLA